MFAWICGIWFIITKKSFYPHNNWKRIIQWRHHVLNCGRIVTKTHLKFYSNKFGFKAIWVWVIDGKWTTTKLAYLTFQSTDELSVLLREIPCELALETRMYIFVYIYIYSCMFLLTSLFPRGTLQPDNTHSNEFDSDVEVGDLQKVKFIWYNNVINPTLPRVGASKITVERNDGKV